jgi:hypothetical protein
MHRYRSSATKSDVAIEKEGPMTRKLAMATAITVIALTCAVGIDTTEAHGFGGGSFHGGGGFHGGFGGFRGRFGRDGPFFGRGFYRAAPARPDGCELALGVR